MSDNIRHPSHYCKGGIECIDAIKAVVSTITDPFEAYCTGNIIKYIWRWNDKNGIEDLHKAAQYIEFIEQHRTAEKSSLVDDDNDMGEEDVSENDEGKWAGMSDKELLECVCDIGLGSACNTGGDRKHDCPFLADSDCGSSYKTLTEFRKIAIEYLEEER